MRLRWRLPAALSACVVVAQLWPLSPVVDVVTWKPPASARLVYPFWHVVLAPLTLLADWLNGGSTRDLIGFGVWALVAYVLVRLAVRRPAATGGEEAGHHGWARAAREAVYAALFVAALAAYLAWGYWLPRPIPRLVATDPADLIFDPHSHTALSHDGRPGFGPAQNAAWHRRAGFDAAFVTDHNVCCAARSWWLEAPHGRPALLQGEEISLSGIHVLALGISAVIPNHPYDGSWDSTGVLVRRLHADSVFLVPTLPEDWRHHTGREWGQLSGWGGGMGGFEIWTTMPRAMQLSPAARRTIVGWARLLDRPVFGSTDMHGYGYTASVWNVTRLPGWREMDDSTLQASLLAHLETGGADANEVVALRRWLPRTRLGAALDVPVNAGLLLRTASRPHALALLGWIWVIAFALSRRRTTPRS